MVLNLICSQISTSQNQPGYLYRRRNQHIPKCSLFDESNIEGKPFAAYIATCIRQVHGGHLRSGTSKAAFSLLIGYRTTGCLAMLTNIDEEDNLARMRRGELYFAFTPQLVGARRRCGQAVGRFNRAGDLSRREIAEHWKEYLDTIQGLSSGFQKLILLTLKAGSQMTTKIFLLQH